MADQNREVIYGLTKDFIFHRAVRFLRQKKVLAMEEYERLDDEARAKAFSVSGYTSLEILQAFLDELGKAAEGGATKEMFRKAMNAFLEEKGYEGLHPWRADTIFRTNMSTAMNAGHYRSMTDPMTMRMRPYWQYMTAGDGKVRDSHLQMHGRVFAADDPVWDIWYPPNGFRCRCYVVSRTRKQIERMGLAVEDRIPNHMDLETGEILPAYPDKGFSNNPAKEVFGPDLTGISAPLKELFRHRQREASQERLRDTENAQT